MGAKLRQWKNRLIVNGFLFIYFFPDDITNWTLETSSKINMKITSTWTWDTSFPDLNQERGMISLPAFLISGKHNDMEVSSDKTVKSFLQLCNLSVQFISLNITNVQISIWCKISPFRLFSVNERKCLQNLAHLIEGRCLR